MSGERRPLIAAVWAGIDVLGFLVLFAFGSKPWALVFLVLVAVGLVAFLRVTHPLGRARPGFDLFLAPEPTVRLEPVPLDGAPVVDDVASDVVILPPPSLEDLPPPPPRLVITEDEPVVEEPVVDEPVVEEPVVEEPVVEEPVVEPEPVEVEPVVEVVVEPAPTDDAEPAPTDEAEPAPTDDAEPDLEADDEVEVEVEVDDEDDEDDDDDTELVTEFGLVTDVIVEADTAAPPPPPQPPVEARSPDEVLEAIIPVDLLGEPATELIDGIEIVVPPERAPGDQPVGAVVRTLEDIEAERDVLEPEQIGPPTEVLVIDDEAVADDADILRASEVAALELDAVDPQDAQAEDARRRQIYLLNKIRLELDEYE